MRKFLMYRILTFTLAAVLFISIAALIYQFYQYDEAEKSYQYAAKLANIYLPKSSTFSQNNTLFSTAPCSPSIDDANITVDNPTKTTNEYQTALNNMDFRALHEINPDVIGWISIPDTNLSYPLLQTGDNKYYLSHTWDKKYNSVGAIFIDYRNSTNFSDQNTIIYGHRVNNNSMFGILHKYTDQTFLAAHPTIYITTESGTLTIDIFAAYEIEITSVYQITTSDTPASCNRIVTLLTCTKDSDDTKRFIVQGVIRQL